MKTSIHTRTLDGRAAMAIRAARLFAAAAAFVAGMLAAAPCMAASAPVATAKTVENIDEPARNPFQQTVGIAGPCTGPCNVSFAAVPAGKTLRILYASCFFSIGDTGGVRLVYVSSGGSSAAYAFVPATAQGNATDVIANAQINLYSAAGAMPVLTIDTNTSPISSGQCTISGYTV